MIEDNLILVLEKQNTKTIDYLVSLSKSQEKKAIDQLISTLNKFSLDKKGTVKTTASNIKLIQTIIEEYRNYIFTSSFTNNITSTLYSHYKEVSKLQFDYFYKADATFSNTAVVNELQILAMNNTINELQLAGIDSQALNMALNAIVNDGVTIPQASKVITQSIPKQLVRYTDEIVTDSLYQYERNVTKLITNDLQLNHFYYSGTTRETTRPFCRTRAGNAYTEAEVRAWGNLPEWDGKIQGTTSKTIFTYLGGYNCRHRLLPITQKRYDALKAK